MELRGSISQEQPLLVVALAEEAAALDSRLPVLVTGPGKVLAASALATVLAVHRPACVINIGTAGALREGMAGVHDIGSVIQHDFDDEGVFTLLGVRYGASISLGPGPVLATGDRFVAGGPLRQQLATRADLCDMEGYAIASVAKAAGIQVRLVKFVSDGADEGAATTWHQALERQAHDIGTWVRDQL